MAKITTDLQAKFKKVIQIPLDPESVEKILAWDIDQEALWECVHTLVTTGHSITFSYDRELQTYSVSVNGKYEHCVNAGYIVYGNGGDFESALKSAIFKTCFLSDDPRWSTLDTAPSKNILW